MAQITDEVLTDMAPQIPQAKLELDPAARQKVSQALRKEVELALNKKA